MALLKRTAPTQTQQSTSFGEELDFIKFSYERDEKTRDKRRRELSQSFEDFLSDDLNEENENAAEEMNRKNAEKTRMIKKIEATVQDIIMSLILNKPIFLKHLSVSWKQTEYTSNCTLDYCYNSESQPEREVSICRVQSRHNLSVLIRLLEKVHSLLSSDTTITKRELYYQFLLPNQEMLDRGVLVVSKFLNSPPWELGILSSGKGLVAGDLVIQFPNNRLDCKEFVLIPPNIHRAISITSKANFVLIVEKDAIFHQIYEQGLLSAYGPNILITGKGYPDLSTRQLVKMISDKLQIPIFILVDADPHGIDIMCTYRFGSMAMCKFSHLLAVPKIKWLGVHPSDIDQLSFDELTLIPFSERDKALATNLLQRPHIIENPLIKHEVEILLQKEVKAEIEALGWFTPHFLTSFYLNYKVCGRKYI